MKWGAAALLLAACSGREPPADCGGDLRGVWRTDDGRRYDVIRTDRGYEWYPMFDDSPDIEGAAPGMIEFPASGDDPLTGVFTRRYERGAEWCASRTAARLHGCSAGRAELDVTPPPPPDFASCVDHASPVVGAPSETWSLLRE